MACRGITTIIDQWNCCCNAGVPTEKFPTHQQKQDKMSYSYYLLCTNCATLMYINAINVMYTYIMLHTIKPTYLMTVYCLRGAAPIGLSYNFFWRRPWPTSSEEAPGGRVWSAIKIMPLERQMAPLWWGCLCAVRFASQKPSKWEFFCSCQNELSS